MPKKSKKRKLNVADFNLTGFGIDDAGVSESVDDCLKAFTASAQVPAQPACQKHDKQKFSPRKALRGKKEWQIDVEKIRLWNQNLLRWIKGKEYTPGLLPNVEFELTRNFKVNELSSYLLKSGNDLRMPVFERWLLDSKLEETLSSSSGLRDPVLPCSTSPKSEASQRLFQELCQNSIDSEQAEKIVGDLCRRTNLECQKLLSSSDRWTRSSPLNRGDRISIEHHESSGPLTILYSRKKWKKPFCFKLNKSHYDKLKARFFDIHNSATIGTALDSGNTRVMHAFNVFVLALLLRYSALSGGQLLQDLRGGGMQGAIHEQVFEVLESNFESPLLEGFASPFNACLSSFCSAFPDLDWHFGSVGSFMDQSFQGCCVQANPPFSPGIMNMMSEQLINQLEAVSLKNATLRFVVIIPTANGTDESASVKLSAKLSHQKLVKSPFCIKHIILPAREHGYVEGAQHLRPTRYKESSYDTSVIILDAHPKNRQEMTSLETKLKDAFASRHEEERRKRSTVTMGDT